MCRGSTHAHTYCTYIHKIKSHTSNYVKIKIFYFLLSYLCVTDSSESTYCSIYLQCVSLQLSANSLYEFILHNLSQRQSPGQSFGLVYNREPQLLRQYFFFSVSNRRRKSRDDNNTQKVEICFEHHRIFRIFSPIYNT